MIQAFHRTCNPSMYLPYLISFWRHFIISSVRMVLILTIFFLNSARLRSLYLTYLFHGLLIKTLSTSAFALLFSGIAENFILMYFGRISTISFFPAEGFTWIFRMVRYIPINYYTRNSITKSEWMPGAPLYRLNACSTIPYVFSVLLRKKCLPGFTFS